MPEFAIREDGLVVRAGDISNVTTAKFVCTSCDARLLHVREGEKTASHFRHAKVNTSCKLSRPKTCLHNELAHESGDAPRRHNAMKRWHKDWQALGRRRHPSRYEARGIGSDPNRPRDLGDAETGQMVELQHSPMQKAEFDTRNAGVSHAVWIFDATEVEIFSYEKYEENLFFCVDLFRHSYKSSNDCNCTVLFHCADGKLYKTMCDDVVRVTLQGAGDRSVRLLRCVRENEQLDDFFGTGNWPLPVVDRMRLPVPVEASLTVLSDSGRKEIDDVHRRFMRRFPIVPLTVLNAPPGAGKTTALLDAICSWENKKVLVVAFNKSVEQTTSLRMRERGIADRASARTIDSLCHGACSNKEDFDPYFSDKTLIAKYWPKSNWFQKLRYGGRSSSDVISFCLRHPHSGMIETCDFHKKLTMFKGSGAWLANLDSFPIKQICSGNRSFGACRLACDRQRLLVSVFASYDVVVVDEAQDLMSAQELRLLRQAPCPLILVGDPMQAINKFRDEPPCTQCKTQQDALPLDLPSAIDLYGTWRLDRFTVKFLEERFDRRMHSFRPSQEDARVFWQTELHSVGNTLVICRSNESVIQSLSVFPGIYIVNGKQLVVRLQSARNDPSQTLPMAKYAQKMHLDEFEKVCVMLREKSVELCDLQNQSAVSTVHQVKGFEYDNCAVHSDLLNPDTEDERNISFVAFTRHRRTLVVLAQASSLSGPLLDPVQNEPVNSKRKRDSVADHDTSSTNHTLITCT